MNPIGGGILLFIAYFGFRGFQRGLVDEVGRLVGLVLAIILSNRFSTLVAGYIGLESELGRKAAAIVGIFIVTLIGISFLTRAVRALVELVLLEWLDRLGGILFGVLKSIVVLGAIIYVVESFEVTEDFMVRLREQSFVYRQVTTVKDGLFKLLTLDDMIKDMHDRVKELEPQDLIRPLVEDD